MHSDTGSSSTLTARGQLAAHFILWLFIYAIPCTLWWTLITLCILGDAAPLRQLTVLGFLIGGPYAGLMLRQFHEIVRKQEALRRAYAKDAGGQAAGTLRAEPGEVRP